MSSFIGNPYQPLRLDESVLDTKQNKTSSENLDMNGFDISGIGHVNGGSLSGFRNRLINSLFQVDIEGNAGGVTTNSAHVVEGWMPIFSNGVTTQTISRVDGDSVPYALRYAITTGSDSSIAAGDYGILYTAIEGYDFSDALWGTANAKSVWISGRIKAPTTGTYCVAVRNSSGTRSYVFEVSCTAATWTDFEKEIPGDTSGTWEKTTSRAILVMFSIATGSTYQTTADTWTAGNYWATSNQANGLATNGNIYEIENIRVSVGGPIPTEYRPYSLDLAHCQRYYEKGYMYSYGYYNTISASASDVIAESMTYAAEKRVVPTQSRSGSSSGTWVLVSNTVNSFTYRKTGVFSTALYTEWYANARMI
jgi:hypothetical protein